MWRLARWTDALFQLPCPARRPLLGCPQDVHWRICIRHPHSCIAAGLPTRIAVCIACTTFTTSTGGPSSPSREALTPLLPHR